MRVPVLSVVAAACAAVLMSGCGKGQDAQAHERDRAPKPVKVTPVTEQTLHRAVEVVGTLAAEDDVTVSSEAEGRVSALRADLGDRVKTGQILVELDAEKSQYSRDQQRAALESALAKYGASDPADLPPVEQTPDALKAAADLQQAKQAYDRAQELHRRQLIPQQGLDDAQTNLQGKQAGYASAIQGARNLRAEITASDATLKLADRTLRDATIRAPFDGFIKTRLVSVGQFVKNQTPVMNIVRMDPLKVTGEIPEKMAPWIHVGQPVTLHVDAFPDKEITGHLSRLSPSVNTSSRAFPFEAMVPNADASLKPGTFARVHIESSELVHVLTIPYSAVQYRYGVNRVFLLEGDHVSLKELKTGEREGDRIEVAAGVRAGDRVVSEDVEKLSDGAKVTVR